MWYDGAWGREDLAHLFTDENVHLVCKPLSEESRGSNYEARSLVSKSTREELRRTIYEALFIIREGWVTNQSTDSNWTPAEGDAILAQ